MSDFKKLVEDYSWQQGYDAGIKYNEKRIKKLEDAGTELRDGVQSAMSRDYGYKTQLGAITARIANFDQATKEDN